MTFYHLTLRRNVRSIRTHGIEGGRSRGKLKVVWLGTRRYCSVIWWHIAQNHGVDPHQVVAIEVNCPRWWRKRRWRGVWISIIDIPPDRVGRWIPWEEFCNEKVF